MHKHSKESVEFKVQGVREDDGRTQFDDIPDDGQIDGAQLTEEESLHLLPHFLMLVIGRPGSGKSYTVKQLVQNKRFYRGKFNDIFAISPSVQKLGIPIPKENTATVFQLDWIFEHIHKINELQLQLLNNKFGMQYKIKDPPKKPATKQELIHQKQLEKARKEAEVAYKRMAKGLRQNAFAINDGPTSSRPSLYAALPFAAYMRYQGAAQNLTNAGYNSEPSEHIQLTHITADQAPVYLKTLSKEEKLEFHMNVLFIFDDVIGTIKKLEYEPQLAQLIMNRRHLIINGTISIILVSQKFSLIPQRVRSNCNWAILFKMNPVDEDFVYKDLVAVTSKTWSNILRYVFGDDSGRKQNEGTNDGGEQVHMETSVQIMKNKKYDNLGIWVDFGVFFMNFKQLIIEGEQPNTPHKLRY